MIRWRPVFIRWAAKDAFQWWRQALWMERYAAGWEWSDFLAGFIYGGRMLVWGNDKPFTGD